MLFYYILGITYKCWVDPHGNKWRRPTTLISGTPVTWFPGLWGRRNLVDSYQRNLMPGYGGDKFDLESILTSEGAKQIMNYLGRLDESENTVVCAEDPLNDEIISSKCYQYEVPQAFKRQPAKESVEIGFSSCAQASQPLLCGGSNRESLLWKWPRRHICSDSDSECSSSCQNIGRCLECPYSVILPEVADRMQGVLTEHIPCSVINGGDNASCVPDSHFLKPSVEIGELIFPLMSLITTVLISRWFRQKMRAYQELSSIASAIMQV